MVTELKADEVRWRCPEEWLPWRSSSELTAATTIVGQDRAVAAIAFGLAIRGIGYNVFVTGLSGTGRLTTIKRFLDQLGEDGPPPVDVVYVFNFKNPEEPEALFLAAGAGRRLRDGMDCLVRELADSLPGILTSQDFRHRLERAVQDLQRQERELLAALEGDVRAAGFSLVQIQAGPITRPEILPVVKGEAVAVDELPSLVASDQLPAAEAERLRQQYDTFRERLQESFLTVADLRRRAQQRAEEVRRELLQPTFDAIVERARETVADDGAASYLDAVRQDLPEHMDLFAGGDDGPDGDPFLRWRINLAVDNAEVHGRPVEIETEPSYANLFGSIERALQPSGEAVTSFRRIRAGSLLRANGGYLVLNAEDLLSEPRTWPSLKRALKYQRVRIQPSESTILGGSGLNPQAVPLDVKVVVIGDRRMYDSLYRYDSDFPKVFKVLADFDAIIPATAEHAGEILSVLAKVIDDEGLTPLDRSGMAAMLEHAVAFGRSRRRFSSRFSDLADLLREASYLAESAGSAQVDRDHVEAAQDAYRRRHNLTEDRIHESIVDGLIRVETSGHAIGQVNGLAVYDLGHYRFGKPNRITARVGLGRDGVINVERQAGLSGPTYDKGVHILTGYLRGTFATKVPLNMACSITFEQSYGGVDGDSASSTEVYAVLSALAELPLCQDIAVTGSVDQLGRVQAIGGVNEKVEGFYRVCASFGLTGSQGVMIPAANVLDLHLDHEVVAAIADGRFHLWPVSSVEEGIEILSGIPAGSRGADGEWSEGSVLARCQRRVDDMATLMRNAGKDDSRADARNETRNGDGTGDVD